MYFLDFLLNYSGCRQEFIKFVCIPNLLPKKGNGQSSFTLLWTSCKIIFVSDITCFRDLGPAYYGKIIKFEEQCYTLNVLYLIL